MLSSTNCDSKFAKFLVFKIEFFQYGRLILLILILLHRMSNRFQKYLHSVHDNFFKIFQIYEGNRNKNHWNMKVLLFMNSNETISHFFSNIYLPFNSEFYVARYTSSKIIFTEVYRISKTSSLILNDICEQSAYNDFNVKNISLYKRRRNFHGFRFKTSAYMVNIHVILILIK